ncbi:MAG: hypothetical protein WBQ94_19480, partial [Terracidiphilus sp.]
TNIVAIASNYPVYATVCSGANEVGCPMANLSQGGPTNVTPTLTSSPSLWFFGLGINPPSSFTLGSTQSTVTANGASGGTFEWTITNGSNEISFASGSQQTTATTSGNTVTIYTVGYSTNLNDATIQLSWTPSGGSAMSATLNLTVDSPYDLFSLGAASNTGVAAGCSASGTSGFLSVVPYEIVSFRGVIIANIGVNESFTGITDDYIGNTWPSYTAAPYVTTNGDFADSICEANSGLTPSALPPQPTLTTVKIDHGFQSWFVGSTNEAVGVEVQTDTLQRYQDHGLHTAITSPVR